CIDIDLALREEQPTPLTMANRMSSMIMSTTFQKPLGVHNLKRLLKLKVSLTKLRNILPKMVRLR
ncbi:hypothetical protein J1N35_008086, partial [Gossypium stocksii]